MELLLEALLILLLVAACSRPIIKTFRSLAPLYQIAGLVLLLLFVGGHLAGRAAVTFPFVPWRMYDGSALNGYTFYYAYLGVTADEDTVRFTPSRVLPTLDRSRIAGALRRGAGRILNAPSDSLRAARLREYEAMIAALAALYDRRWQTTLREVIALQCSIRLEQDKAAPPIRCYHFQDVPIE